MVLSTGIGGISDSIGLAVVLSTGIGGISDIASVRVELFKNSSILLLSIETEFIMYLPTGKNVLNMSVDATNTISYWIPSGVTDIKVNAFL